MQYLGDYAAGETVYFAWNSVNSSGASVTRSTNGTISVYKDNNTTQTTTGVTDTEDFDGLTGVHHCAIATSDGFYTTATDFMVVLSAATIDSQTVNAVLAHFSIENRAALRPTTAGRTLDVSATGAAGVDWANVESQSTSVTLSATTVGTVTALATGAITATTIATGAIDADALATDAVTEIQSAVAAGSVSSVTGSVGSIAAGGIDSASFAAGAITAGAIAPDAIGASELAADAVTEIQSGLATAADLATVDTVVDAIKVTTDKLDTTLEADGPVWRFTTNALEQAPTGGSAPTAAEVADAVWDEDATGHQTQGSFGQVLGDSGADTDTVWGLVNTNLNATVSSRATQTSVDTIDDFLDTEIAAIKTKTDQLTFTVANQVDATASSIAVGAITAGSIATGAIDADALSADAVDEIWDEVMEGATTARESLRLANTANGGKLSGAATTNVLIRDLADSKNRVNATVDADGNRTAVTLDLS